MLARACVIQDFAKWLLRTHSTCDSTLNLWLTLLHLNEGQGSNVSRESNAVRNSHFAEPCIHVCVFSCPVNIVCFAAGYFITARLQY